MKSFFKSTFIRPAPRVSQGMNKEELLAWLGKTNSRRVVLEEWFFASNKFFFYHSSPSSSTSFPT